MRPGRLRRGALVSLVAMGAVALGACGVPIGGAPTVIANNQINPNALTPPPTMGPRGRVAARREREGVMTAWAAN